MPLSETSPVVVDLDLVIIGGGIAGLWLLNRARATGYQCALFEKNALGSDQTIASQGMIHGGMKYTLAGALSNASETIAEMPTYWRSCLAGEGDIDLRLTRILSDHFFLWSSETASSRLATFLASKLLRGRVEPVPDHHRPSVLRHHQFSGSLYRIGDLVLDVPSLLANLANPVSKNLFHIDWSQAQLQRTASGRIELLLKPEGAVPVLIRAQRFVFTAGKGNADLLTGLGLTTPEAQERPLHQVMVKHNSGHRLYGHCLGVESTPRLTISSHSTADGSLVWYMGGSLAENGVNQTAGEVIAAAQQELGALMPWLDFSGSEWASLRVTRAEQRQRQFARPDDAFVGAAEGAANLLVAWPTKLTLVPNLARQVLALLRADKLQPAAAPAALALLRQLLPHPPLAPTPWDLAFPPAMREVSDEI